LEYLAFAFNSTQQKCTGFTTNFLHHGRELNSHVSVLLANPGVEQPENYGQFTEELVKRLSSAFELTRECLDKHAQSSKRYYDSKVKVQSYGIGDKVLFFYPRQVKNRYPKWQRLYANEGEIVSKVNDIIYIVKMVKGGKQRLCHVDNLSC
jgi:hypothetical protein